MSSEVRGSNNPSRVPSTIHLSKTNNSELILVGVSCGFRVERPLTKSDYLSCSLDSGDPRRTCPSRPVLARQQQLFYISDGDKINSGTLYSGPLWDKECHLFSGGVQPFCVLFLPFSFALERALFHRREFSIRIERSSFILVGVEPVTASPRSGEVGRRPTFESGRR